MPNYAVEDFSTSLGTHAEVLAEMETELETVDDTKTIRMIGISPLSRDRDRCVGFIIYDT
ncbi:MAG: hypothetical protein ACYSW3_00260 [Planctomycetota bacterium]|jgi:hypothetical protein